MSPSRAPSQSSRTPAPVRLKVSYRSAESLLGEFTRSVGQGSVLLPTERALEVGTRFVFEMRASGLEPPLEVLGEVVQVTPRSSGGFLVEVRYDAPSEREGLERVLEHIFAAHRLEPKRRHPRIPLYVRASHGNATSPIYLVRDLSRGGVGLEMEGRALPPAVRVGAPMLLEMKLSLGELALYGEVVWMRAPAGAAHLRTLPPAFGVRFGRLRPDTVALLEHLLRLRALPPPPWRARVSFGLDALNRMPG